MLDNAYKIETPEGVWLHLNIAGPIPRALAIVIDLAVYIAIWFVLFFVMSLVTMILGPEISEGIALILIFVLSWFYFVAFEMWNRGRTIGKMVLGLQVVCDDGTPLTWKASMLRNLMRVADFLPFFYAFGFLSCMMSRRFKRLGDLAAGTLVIYTEEKAKPVAEFNVGKPEPPKFSYSSEEQRGIVAFAERAHYLGPARAEEVANHLEPLTQLRGKPAVHSLLQQAAWLVGRRP
jgi:uncharacterized RDD family membrane protein YckC